MRNYHEHLFANQGQTLDNFLCNRFWIKKHWMLRSQIYARKGCVNTQFNYFTLDSANRSQERKFNVQITAHLVNIFTHTCKSDKCANFLSLHHIHKIPGFGDSNSIKDAYANAKVSSSIRPPILSIQNLSVICHILGVFSALVDPISFA